MEPVRDYELRSLFTYVIEVLERLNVPYMVVGGFAAIFYGEPRLTLDVDIVVDITEDHIAPFLAAFPLPVYYASEEGIRDSLRRCYPFNIIQPTTGAKIDMVPLLRDPFTLNTFQRRQRMTYDEAGHTAVLISAEDLILAKLRAFRETGSEKHLYDARGVLAMQWEKLDLETIRQQAQALGLSEFFENIVGLVGHETDD